MGKIYFFKQTIVPIEIENGKSEAEQFKEIYSEKYFDLFRDRELEDEVMKILENDTWSSDDIIKVLCWKMGASNSSSNGEKRVKGRWREVEVGRLIDKIQGVKKISDNPEETLQILMEPKGIGAVYAVTLLFFMSKGKYPIYDKYAHMALDAIETGKQPGDEIPYKELPTAPKSIMEKVDEYAARIKNIFGKNALADRDVDRALWAYGHSFIEAKKER